MQVIPAGRGLKKELHIQLLGGFAVSLSGARIPEARWKSRRARNLIKLLALAPGWRLHRDQVCETFWPNLDPSAASNNFHRTLYLARKVLETHNAGVLVLEEGFLNLAAGPRQVLQIDVEQFEAAAALAKDSQDPRAYQDALAYYPGDLLPDDLYEEWTIQRRQTLRHTFLQLLLDLARLHETHLEYSRGIEVLQQVLSIDQSLEEVHTGLMRLYAFSGQPQQAVRQYHALQETLSQELGLEPSHATAQLFEAIQSGGFSPSLPRSHPAHNLPFQPTSILGRETEIETLRQVILSEGSRLVTVTGVGGTGKTRLALETAWTLMPAFPDGVYLVELDARQAQETLAPLIARAVGLKLAAESILFGSPAIHILEERLFSFLQDKKLLLILDGFERMIAETGWLDRLLRRTSELVVLATSRIRLNLNAEQVFLLNGLPCPQQEAEMAVQTLSGAVQLFEQAARRRRPGFTLNAANTPAVVAICRVLQGMPLGILLAAAWTEVLEPEQIAQQIRHSLDFLTVDWADLPDRQHSLRATFEYSLQMLGQTERAAFLRLSIFRGAFTAQSAWQVAEVPLNTLKILVDHSLVRPAGQGRVRIHELLRQYAQEELAADPAEEQAIRERHCQVLMTTLADLEPRLKSSSLFAALEEMDLAYPDFLEAWHWAAQHGEIRLLENAAWTLWRYQMIRSLFGEGAGLFEKTMERLERDGIGANNLRLWVRLGTHLADFLIYQQKEEACRQVLDRVESELSTQPALASGLRREQGHLQTARGVYCALSNQGRLKARTFTRGV